MAVIVSFMQSTKVLSVSTSKHPTQLDFLRPPLFLRNRLLIQVRRGPAISRAGEAPVFMSTSFCRGIVPRLCRNECHRILCTGGDWSDGTLHRWTCL